MTPDDVEDDAARRRRHDLNRATLLWTQELRRVSTMTLLDREAATYNLTRNFSKSTTGAESHGNRVRK